MKIVLGENYHSFSAGTEVYFVNKLKCRNDKIVYYKEMCIEDSNHKELLNDAYFKSQGSMPKLKIVIE